MHLNFSKIRIVLSLIMIYLCINCQKNDNYYPKIEFEKKQKILENIGKIYFEKNCFPCHQRKGSTDNFLIQSIKLEVYDFEYFKNFTKKQDSLLKNKNQ